MVIQRGSMIFVNRVLLDFFTVLFPFCFSFFFYFIFAVPWKRGSGRIWFVGFCYVYLLISMVIG